MRIPKSWVRTAAGALAFLASLYLAYRAGYDAGLKDKGPDFRALAVVRAPAGGPGSGGTSFTWFDVSKPMEAESLRKQEALLQARGADYYVAKGVEEKTLSPEPDPRRVNAHR